MQTILYFSCSAILILGGCERVDDPSDIPFVERLVVHGELVPTNPLSVTIEKTIPLSGQYSNADAELTDVTGVIVTQSVSYPIVHRLNGRYSCNYLPVSPGQDFVMYLDWHGKKVSASTTMPHPAQIDTIVTFVDSSAHAWVLLFESVVTPRSSEAYIIGWVVRVGSTFFASGESSLLRSQDAATDGKLHAVNQVQLTENRVDSVSVFVWSYDMAYYEFFASQGNTGFETVPLITYFTGPVRWNVKGDGVGLFVARNSARKTIRFVR